MPLTAHTFFEHLDTFFDYRRTVYEASEQTIKSNRIDLNLFKEFLENRPDDTIDGPTVIAFQYYLKNERKNGGGSINRKIFTLRRYAQHLRLVDVEEAVALPFDNVRKIRQGYRQRPLALTLEQIKQLFSAIDRGTVLGIRDYAVYALMFLAGLRVGEVHQLNLESIDFDQRLLIVNGKGNKQRTINLHEELFLVLSEFLAVRHVFHRQDLSPALFVSRKGNRLAIRTMEDNFKKIVKKADLDVGFPVTCHTLRHTFASYLNDKEVDILVIQSLLGHATPKSTEAYIHPSQENIRKAMDKLPAVIFMKKLIETGMLNLTFQNNIIQKE
jgi:site-specific recombinase XerD